MTCVQAHRTERRPPTIPCWQNLPAGMGSLSVITNDGRHIVGTLRGFDQVTNVILEDCAERVYSSESGVEEAPLGVYMIRGDNVCVNARRRRRGGRGIEWTEDARARSNARDAKD